MEPIILLIISLIIGTLFKGKENQKPPAQKPNQAPRQEVPKRPAAQGGNLKDLTKQLYEDLQKEIQKEAKEFRTDPREADSNTAKPEPVRSTRRNAENDAGRARESAPAAKRGERQERQERTRERMRPTAAPVPVSRKPEPADPDSLFPESEEELARAIVFAEILGPPKAKRR
ncbi:MULTISPECIES: hypothetical protein [Bhargavaea]|uniref:Uncharacterized protein n=1 Tax=Bhargavaea changchunensis TaxID=2134037 RepID=A0ABW2NF97_9BACL|nr:hypothetical protein [Bhargavaea sp. CC-171006]